MTDIGGDSDGTAPDGTAAESPGAVVEGAITTSAAIEYMGLGKFQKKTMALCGMIWMADSMEMTLMSFLLPEVKRDLGITAEQEAAIGSVTFLGMLLGAGFWGIMSDRVGRRLTYVFVASWTAFFALCSALSPDFEWLMATRGLVGVGVGGAPVAFSLFAEFVPTAHRGTTLVLLEGAFWSTGTVMEALLGMAVLGDGTGPPQWRWLLVWSALPVVLVCCILLMGAAFPELDLLPESAHWLLVNGRGDEAEAVLRSAAAQNNKPFPAGVSIARLAYDPAMEKENGSVSKLFATSELRLTTLLLWGIWFSAVGCYYGLVLVTPSYFGTKGLAITTSSLIGACSELPGLAVAIALIDRIGRRRTIGFFFGVNCVACGVLAAGATTGAAGLGALTVAAVLGRGAMDGAFASTYVYTPEVYPTTVRSTGVGMASSVGRVAGTLTPFLTNYLGDPETGNVGLPVLVFSAVSAMACVLTFLLPFETCGGQLQSSAKHAAAEPHAKPRAKEAADGATGSASEKKGLLARSSRASSLTKAQVHDWTSVHAHGAAASQV